MGSDFSKQREEIKKSSCPINILVIGEQYEGKSSLINTLYYAANDERLPIAEVAPTGLTANRWTTKFRKHRITSTINAFDVPGMNFRTDVQLFLLEKLLLGANTNQNIPLEEDTLQNLLKESKLSENVENRIDFILWVVDATKLESNSGKFLLWKWAQLSLQTRAYYEKLFTFVRNKSELGLYPYLVYTKKDKAYLSEKQLLQEAFPFFNNGNKWLIQNYVKRDDFNQDTEYTALRMLRSIQVMIESLYEHSKEGK